MLFLNARGKPITRMAIWEIVQAYARKAGVINRLRRKPEAQKEPTEKNCPFCFTVIPIRAVRCPNCTSELGT
jgi:large conductance mechanosensitive channel